jgi:hypothetical protein
MEILNSIGVRIRCPNCGDAYTVPLRDVLLSDELLHEGCPVAEETECPPLFQSRLAPQPAIEALVRAWREIEERARRDGGELIWIGSTSPNNTAYRDGRDIRDPEDRHVPPRDEAAVREKMLDKTLADSYPASDPPSSLPNVSRFDVCSRDSTLANAARCVRVVITRLGTAVPLASMAGPL